MIIVAKKNIWTPHPTWGQPKFQKGMLRLLMGVLGRQANPFSFKGAAGTVVDNLGAAQDMNVPGATVVSGDLLVAGMFFRPGIITGWTRIDNLNLSVYYRTASGVLSADAFPWPQANELGIGWIGIYGVFGTRGTSSLLAQTHIQQFGLNQYVVPELVESVGAVDTLVVSCGYKIEQSGNNTATPIFQSVSGGWTICHEFFLDSDYWPNYGYSYYAMCFALETVADARSRAGYVYDPWQGGSNSASEGTSMRFEE